MFNSTTIICNSTLLCTAQISFLQARIEDAQRLNYILGTLLGLISLVSLLFLCVPLISNRPKAQLKDDDIELGNMVHADRFAVAADQENSRVSDDGSSTVTYFGIPREYRGVMPRGENDHVQKSDTSTLLDTGVFRGLANQRELAAKCVRVDESSGSRADEESILGNISIDITELNSVTGHRAQEPSYRKLC